MFLPASSAGLHVPIGTRIRASQGKPGICSARINREPSEVESITEPNRNETSTGRGLKVITDGAEFSRLQHTWNAIVSSESRYTIFSTWEWAYCWWRHYAESTDELFLVTLEVDGQPCGVAPFYRHREDRNDGSATNILLLGTGGDEWDEVTSIYLDLIVRDEYRETFVELLVERFQQDPEWNTLELQDLYPDSILHRELLPRLQSKGFLQVTRNSGYSFPISLERCFETYLARLSKNRKKAIRQNRARFERAGHLSQVALTEPVDVDWFLDTLRELHLHKHDRERGESAFASDRFVEFHRELLTRIVPKGWVDLRIVCLDGRPISALYNYRFDNWIYSYQSGHQYDRWSPGLLADTYAITEACEQGIVCYDLLKGEPGSFKNSLDADQRELLGVVVFASKAEAIGQKMLEKFRQVRDLAIASRQS